MQWYYMLCYVFLYRMLSYSDLRLPSFTIQLSVMETRQTVTADIIYPIINTLGSRQDGRHFPDYIFKSIFLNENVWIPIKISLKFVPKGPINNIPALVQIMAWRRPGDKPLSEPMMVSLLTHLCVTRPQWLKGLFKQFRNLLKYWIVKLVCAARQLILADKVCRGDIIGTLFVVILEISYEIILLTGLTWIIKATGDLKIRFQPYKI